MRGVEVYLPCGQVYVNKELVERTKRLQDFFVDRGSAHDFEVSIGRATLII